jgi:hypothetical protein
MVSLAAAMLVSGMIVETSPSAASRAPFAKLASPVIVKVTKENAYADIRSGVFWLKALLQGWSHSDPLAAAQRAARAIFVVPAAQAALIAVLSKMLGGQKPEQNRARDGRYCDHIDQVLGGHR